MKRVSGRRETEALTRAAPGPVKAHDAVDALLGVHEQLSPPQLRSTLRSGQPRGARWPVPAVGGYSPGLHAFSTGWGTVTPKASRT